MRLEGPHTVPELTVLLSKQIVALLVRNILSFAARKAPARGLRVDELRVHVRVAVIDALVVLDILPNLTL